MPNIWEIFTICSILLCQNLVKSLINIYHLFSIILPKPCQIFAKSLTKKIQQLTQYNSVRMIYFRENSIVVECVGSQDIRVVFCFPIIMDLGFWMFRCSSNSTISGYNLAFKVNPKICMFTMPYFACVKQSSANVQKWKS